MKLEFSSQIFENPSKSNFIKIRPVGEELVQADKRTDSDMTKLNNSSSKLC